MLRFPTRASRTWIPAIVIAVLRHLEHPLPWNDEAETAMCGQRILTFGYPKVDDGRNLACETNTPLSVAVKEPGSVYIGSTWGQYYVGALGVAFAARTGIRSRRLRACESIARRERGGQLGDELGAKAGRSTDRSGPNCGST